MPVRLPLVPSIPNYRVATSLDGTPYILDVRWNGREEAWYLDILDDDENPIRRGMKLVLGTIIGKGTTNPDFPPGSLALVDLANTGVDAGLDDMGDRVGLYYYSPGEDGVGTVSTNSATEVNAETLAAFLAGEGEIEVM